MLTVASIFCHTDVIIGLIIGVVIFSGSVEPEPVLYSPEDVFIALAPQDIQEGTIIEQEMFVPAVISPDMLIRGLLEMIGKI